MKMTPRSAPQAISDNEIRTLLDRYRCPAPFHAVRTRFLGSIASPGLSVAPLDTVKALWGGELPKFDSLLAVLVMGGTSLVATITGVSPSDCSVWMLV